MKIGLASYRLENKNIPFNLSQIEIAMKKTKGKVDILCFGEAFLQGFESLCWDYDIDKNIAVELESKSITLLKQWTIKYGMALLTGYIEKAEDTLYSSCIVIDNGEIVCNYRRISKGWKEVSKTDWHYAEGTEIKTFSFHGRDISIALCGDLWEYPERFSTEDLLIWPVYVNYDVDEWEHGELEDYARQASIVAPDVLMVNSMDTNPVNHGGSFYFKNAEVLDRTYFDEEQILIVNI